MPSGNLKNLTGGREQKYNPVFHSNAAVVLVSQGNHFFPVNEEEKEQEEGKRRRRRRRRRKRWRKRSQLQCSLPQQCSRVVLIPKVIVSCFPVNKAEEREKNAEEEEVEEVNNEEEEEDKITTTMQSSA